jgi:hypothetical protein
MRMSQVARLTPKFFTLRRIFLSAVAGLFAAMQHLSQHVVPDLPEVFHVCITSARAACVVGTANHVWRLADLVLPTGFRHDGCYR